MDRLSNIREPLLSIVIVAYQSRNEIGACLESLPSQIGGFAVQVVVVDNSPGDGTADLVRDRFPDVVYLAPSENLGFGRANNLGYAHTHPNSRFILFLNPDTVCNEKALAHCVARLEADPRIGLISPKLVLADGSMDLACRRSIPTLWDGFCRATGLAAAFPNRPLFAGYNLTHLPDGGTYEVGAINGAFMLGRRKVFETIAMPARRPDEVIKLKFKEGGTPTGGPPVEDPSLKFKGSVPPLGGTPDEGLKLKFKGADGRLRAASNLPTAAISSGPKAYSLPPTASSSSAVFDESFFMYGDDLDLCIRVARAGWKIIYDGSVSIIHLKGLSVANDYTRMACAIFDANRDVYLKHFNPRGSRWVRWKYSTAFSLWKCVALSKAKWRGHRAVRPV